MMKTRSGASLWLLLGLLLLGMAVFRGGDPRGWVRRPPAPSGRKAPDWDSRRRSPAEDRTGPRQPEATYAWPPDFELPLEIVIDNLPEVPQRIVGPSPPIGEDEEPMR